MSKKRKVSCLEYNIWCNNSLLPIPLSKLLPAVGYYRIWTTEENLDLLFVTILAFARTEAVDAEGGTYGLLLGKK